MSREIKFRVWDLKEKRMYNRGVEVGNILYEITANSKHDLADEYVLMQFTGLKDKNGKEIYEGDILKYRYNRDTSGKDVVEFTEVIEWENDMEWCGFNIHKTMDFEIIGNIYENPELVSVHQL